MATDALTLLLEQLVEKERQAAAAFSKAQADVGLYQQQLSQLNDYRKQYLQQFQERGLAGLSASDFSHYQAFVSRLEQAEKQQQQALEQIKQEAERKKQGWLEAQQKRKAVELLLEKKAAEAALKASKAEQKMLDEFALYQHFRKTKSDML